LGRSTEQVRRYLREGKLPGRRIGGQWFIREPVALYQAREGDQKSMSAWELGHPGGDEYGAAFRRKLSPGEVRALAERIDRRREGIRERLGHELDVVKLVRESREGLR
jgi:hypothetical protein